MATVAVGCAQARACGRCAAGLRGALGVCWCAAVGVWGWRWHAAPRFRRLTAAPG
jgi:hypothetical protein